MSALVPIPPEALRENRRCFIALPWYRNAHPLTAVALLQLFQRDRMTASISFGDAFVAHARNKLASKFLLSKFEWMLMLDDDTVPPCGNAEWFNEVTGLKLPEWAAGLNTVERLISHGKTLVGATYFARTPGGPPVFAEGPARANIIRTKGPSNEVIPTKWVGTGCCLFHRTVFEDVEKKFPHLSRDSNKGTGQWFTSSEHDLHAAVGKVVEIMKGQKEGDEHDPERIIQLLEYGLYQSSVHSTLGMGEDVQLCVRATQAGHQPHIDLGLWCAHFGPASYPQK